MDYVILTYPWSYIGDDTDEVDFLFFDTRGHEVEDVQVRVGCVRANVALLLLLAEKSLI